MKNNSRIYDTVEPVRRSRDDALIAEAKTLARLQAKRRNLRSQLREVARQIRVTQRNIRIMKADWHESGVQLKTFGGG